MALTKICIAANEDGFGPSAFAYYLIRAVCDAWRSQRRKGALQISLLNKRACSLNQALHAHHDEVQLIQLDSLIRLERHNGEVCVPRTLRLLSAYQEEQGRYFRKVKPHLRGCALAIDVGVPLLTHAANRLKLPNITVFDHSWACTLRGVTSTNAEYVHNPVPTDTDRALAGRIASAIEQDEKTTNEVFLFDYYLSPPEFREHWKELGRSPKILSGVFGYRHDRRLAKNTLDQILIKLGQQPVPDGRRLALITPGGTPVWNSFLVPMIENYLSGSSKDYLPVLAPCNVSKRLKDKMAASSKIRWFDFVPGATLQAIISAFSLVVSKAGAGTVNDCLANRIPLVCVEERQWQVQLIERECKRLGLIPTMRETALDKFRVAPVRCIDLFVAKYAGRRRPILRTGAELELATAILLRL